MRQLRLLPHRQHVGRVPGMRGEDMRRRIIVIVLLSLGLASLGVWLFQQTQYGRRMANWEASWGSTLNGWGIASRDGAVILGGSREQILPAPYQSRSFFDFLQVKYSYQQIARSEGDVGRWYVDEYWSISIGLWMLALLFLLYPAIFSVNSSRRRRRSRQLQGLCIACGYSLTGNTSGVCPECGRAVHSDPAPR